MRGKVAVYNVHAGQRLVARAMPFDGVWHLVLRDGFGELVRVDLKIKYPSTDGLEPAIREIVEPRAGLIPTL